MNRHDLKTSCLSQGFNETLQQLLHHGGVFQMSKEPHLFIFGAELLVFQSKQNPLSLHVSSQEVRNLSAASCAKNVSFANSAPVRRVVWTWTLAVLVEHLREKSTPLPTAIYTSSQRLEVTIVVRLNACYRSSLSQRKLTFLSSNLFDFASYTSKFLTFP